MSNELTTRDNDGPAMSQLTDKQRLFVLALLDSGGQNEAEAARRAGYSQNHPNNCSAWGWHLVRNPKVLAAMREEAEKRLRGNGVLAVGVLTEVMMDRNHKDRVKAAVEVLNRSGLDFIQKHEHVHKVERTDAENEAMIIEFARRNHMDPVALLGYDPFEKPVDVEFTEVAVDPAQDNTEGQVSDDELFR